MIDYLLSALTALSAISCALVGGVFFAFSTFIMKALGRLPAPQGIAAMQAINVTVITPSFMMALFGTGAACVALAVVAVLLWHTPRSAYLFAGSLLYLTGTLVVTMAFNVPRNDALASIAPTSLTGESIWKQYLAEWTAWNHVRTAAALVAAALLTTALCLD